MHHAAGRYRAIGNDDDWHQRIDRNRPCQHRLSARLPVFGKTEAGRHSGTVGRPYRRAYRRHSRKGVLNLRWAGFYFHTLRHLKPVQIWGRLVFRLIRPTPDLRPAPLVREPRGLWHVPAARQPSMLSPIRFCFLNEERTVASAEDWNSPQHAKLWTYNLHYFDDLNAVAAREREAWHRAHIQRWITEDPPGCGVGWEPYPLSLRIVNWIKWSLAGGYLDDNARHSLAVQVRYLRARLERHLMGNHLFANAKALVFAGCYFDGKEAAGWLRCGMAILARELPEQILPDGGQFERSTMYHALAYEDMLDLGNVGVAFPQVFVPWASEVDCWPAVLSRMGHWLAAMCHTDGEIAFFNDAAIGIAPPPSDLFAYARRLGYKVPAVKDGVVHLKESGYIRVQRGRAVMLIDVAPVGPDYLPGHAHADTLSFELSLNGQRVIVNSGTSSYAMGPEREWERSTEAHSTVEVDRQNSSEVWAGFRVARRAYPFGVAVHESDVVIEVKAAHDGYQRLSGRSIHRRTWRLNHSGLTVMDEVHGHHSSAVARYHIHPRISIEAVGEGGQMVWDGSVAIWRAEIGKASMTKFFYAPAFGVKIAAPCIELHGVDGQVTFALNWSE